MTLPFEISENLNRILNKLAIKDKALALAIAIRKKMDQIIKCDIVTIQHFKNLRHDLSHLKRVQVGSFVLIFQLKGDVIIFEDFDHHDRIYKKNF